MHAQLDKAGVKERKSVQGKVDAAAARVNKYAQRLSEADEVTYSKNSSGMLFFFCLSCADLLMLHRVRLASQALPLLHSKAARLCAPQWQMTGMQWTRC